MTAILWIIGILAFLVLLGLLPLHADLVLSDSDGDAALSVYARVLFVRILLFPRRKKLPRLGKYKIGALKRRGRILDRKEQKEKRKKEKKAAELKKQKKSAAKKDRDDRSAGQKTVKRNLKHILRLAAAIIKTFLKRFGRYLRIEASGLEIAVATEDPAQTAVLYGAVYLAAETFFDAFAAEPAFRKLKKSDLALYADFSETKPHLHGKITFTLCVWQLFAILLPTLISAVCVLNRNRKEQKNETAEERTARERSEARAREEVLRELKS